MFDRSSFASGANARFIEEMYEEFRKGSSDLDDSWRRFFQGYEFALQGLANPVRAGEDERRDSAKVEAFINAYRRLGHLSAHLNPLDSQPEIAADMMPECHGLKNVEPHRKFLSSNFGNTERTFAEIWDKLKATYCGKIGPDFRDSNDIEAVKWLQDMMESCNNQPSYPVEVKKRILQKLAEAEGFEQFLHSRYLGQKRFSLEGLETLIPLMDVLVDEAANVGVAEICMGMAHRGRLNLLVNILKKSFERMFIEFEGSEFNPFDIDGDVKYHLGFANQIETFSGKKIRMYLSPNPSHLEAVNPLVEGFTRARQETLGGDDAIMPILLHGDASFIGQGIVAEVLNLSQLPAYKTGGTIHIITNNQIGFTTNPRESRSCDYSSDICKIIRAPVFHVNADDPEAAIWVAKLAVQYRKKFKRDVVIDLVGYRRRGHNETDEPGFTQPLLYKKIEEHPTTLTLYGEKLVREGSLNKEEIDEQHHLVRETLQKAQTSIKSKSFHLHKIEVPAEFKPVFSYRKPERQEVTQGTATEVRQERLISLGQRITQHPESFHPHPKVKRVLENREKMLQGKGSIDWAFAELLAFASLAEEGFNVRLTGQDCRRGTFSSRHAVLLDYESNEPFELLKQIKNGNVEIINSPLSEQGCLGFEFGYSVANPNTLVLWEAQFGDFANGAQIVVDQFLVASEAKWQQTSGLVMLLPHGYEGMGPEHSSARPERFLQCCGNLNIQVCNVSTPAQLFHVLRRQMLRQFRKPLVLMTPKSLLRHPKVQSPMQEFTGPSFQEVIDDPGAGEREKAARLIMCTGKIYYELAELRDSRNDLEWVPILRLEQLYPFPYERLEEVRAQYSNIRELVWVQEEPENMGAWTFVQHRIPRIFGGNVKVSYKGRKNSGSTAEGSAKAHQVEQKRILDEAFALVCAWEPKLVVKKS